MNTSSPFSSIDTARSAAFAGAGHASRGSLAGSLWTLYVLSLRQHLRGKRWLAMGALFLLPAALAVLLRTVATDVPLRGLEFFLVFLLMPHALLPIVALVYASGIIRDEQEEQTITYLLVRPIPKPALYVVKLLATITTATFLTVVFTALTYLAIYLGGESQSESVAMRCVTAASIHALSVVTYCSLFGLLSLFTRRMLVVGVLYTAVVEGLLANLPFGIRLITVIYYARIIAYRMMSFTVTTPNGQTEDIAAEAWQLNVQLDPKLVEHPQLSTCFFILVAASVVSIALGAWLCSSREFHVKTPENV